MKPRKRTIKFKMGGSLSEDKQSQLWSQVSADFKELTERVDAEEHHNRQHGVFIYDLKQRVAALEAACEFCLRQEDKPNE